MLEGMIIEMTYRQEHEELALCGLEMSDMCDPDDFTEEAYRPYWLYGDEAAPHGQATADQLWTWRKAELDVMKEMNVYEYVPAWEAENDPDPTDP